MLRPLEETDMSAPGTGGSPHRDRNWIAPAIAIGIVAGLIVPVAISLHETAPSPQGNSEFQAFAGHIDHIIFLIMENHAFDNYYGDYCLNVSSVCPHPNDGLPADTCVPLHPLLANTSCARPFPYTPANWSIDLPLPHNWNSSMNSFAGGKMNGFYAAERSNLTPFGYYDGSTAPIYWDIAQQYALGDAFFSSTLSYSLPNHWHIVAGQSPQQILQNFTGLGPAGGDATVAGDHKYLDQANQTRSIEDLLLNSPVSWKYYDTNLGNYSHAISFNNPGPFGNHSAGPAYDYWNPQAAKAESYTAAFTTHFLLNTNFFGDARNGTLPHLTWLVPPGQDSDHPSQSSAAAQGYVGSVVNAVESSPDWGSTALFIAWDDYGGFYDHVPPPAVDGGLQLGFRVPLLIVSPYVRAGTVTDQFGYFESILHLMEWRYNLGCLTTLDCNAPLPLAAFDFNQSPRAPVLFPTNVTQATYPMPTSGLGTALAGLPPYYPPSEYTHFPKGQAPDVD